MTRAAELRRAFDADFAAALPPPAPAHSDFLCIRVGGEPFAAPLADIASLHADLRIVALPTRTPELLGVAALRAAVVPIYDAGVAFGLPGNAAPRWTLLLRSGMAGFAFEGYDGYVRIPDRSIAAVTQRGHVRGQFGVNGQQHSVVDLGSVLTAIEHGGARVALQRTNDMFRNWTFGRKVGAGFAVTALALVVIAVTGYRSAKSLIENDERVSHTQLVRRELADLLVQLLNAETGQRGFVITGKEEFLEPYTAALSEIDATYADVRRLTLDNPGQTHRLDVLRPAIDGKLAELKDRITLRRAGSFEAAAASIASGEGKRTMDRIRAVLDEMDREESGLLDLRRREAETSTETTKVVLVWGSVAAIVITILVGWFITRALSKQIGSAVRHVQSSSTELQTTANQQATGAREQSTAMTEIATTINELLATSRQIADSAKRVSQIAGQTATAARTGEITVTKGHDATSTVRKQVDLIVGHMLELGKKSQQVGSVLDIVAELAEQTNILAINATIEAAGAGDAGRRFGVVADEIRKLADRVAASTKEIRTMVEDVRSAVNTTVMATEAGSKAVDVSTAQVLEMATAFRQISSLVGTTTDAAREIELSTKQQATAVEQVNLAITSAAGATRETEASATQTLQTASQLTDLSTSLLQIVQKAS